jgi:hypothetical protein
VPRLGHEIPSWVASYVGLPFEERGRDRAGIDCWGLYRLVCAERFGVYLPSLADHYLGLEDLDGLAAALAAERGPGGSGWLRIDCGASGVILGGKGGGQLGDLLEFQLAGCIPHVGMLVARDQVLHAFRGTDSCCERIDTPKWERRLRGVWRVNAPVHLVGRLRPFGDRRIDAHLPAGLSVAEILEAQQITATPMLRVFVGDREVPPERWAHVRPRPGRMVTVAATPLGGGNGKTALRIVATIALIAVSAGAGSALLEAGYTATQAAVAGGLITLAGGLLISALIPPPKPRLSGEEDRSSPTITGGRNEIRQYGVIPQVLGYHRFVPPFAAVPYTENVGDDQYLRMLFAFYGPLEISDIRIGDTPIEEFEGVELEVRSGLEDEDPISLYPGTINEEPLSILLEESAGFQVRTSRPDVDELSVDITFPTGLAEVEADGSRTPRTVGVEVEYSPAGAGTWQLVNGGGGASGSPANAGEMRMLFRTPEVVYGGDVYHEEAVSWGGGFAGAKPAYLPATGYSWSAWAYLRVTSPGTYRFSVDSSDAADVFVRGRPASSFYGTHAAAGSYDGQAGDEIELGEGFHRIEIRMEARSGAGAVSVAWSRDGGAWEVIPAAVYRLGTLLLSPQGLGVRWFVANGYASTIATTAAQTTPLRRSLAWAVERGQYDVRLRRVTADTAEDRILDDVYWTALRSIKNEDPIRLADLAKIALRIKATDQLSGGIDQLNFLGRSIVPDWDAASETWITRGTNNPASIYCWILQGRANARPVADHRIDLAELASWHEACDEEGLTFNAVIDFPGTVYERLADVAAAGRATFGMRDGKFSIVRDRPQTTPVQHFTPRNSWGFSAERAFPDLPHALRIRFLDEENGYQQTERIVLDDGYQLDGLDAFGVAAPELPLATRYESLEFFGVTGAEQIWKHGRYYLAVAKLRPEISSISVDVEHLACNRGDLVYVTHDVPLWGDGYGRLMRRNLDSGGNLVGFDLDDEVTMDAGVDYRLRVRLEDNSDWVRAVVPVEGVHRRVTLSNPISAAETWPQAGDLYMFGRAGLDTRELLVRSIEIERDMSARLTLVDHAPAVHLADQGVIPPWDPGISRPPVYQDGPEVPSIVYIQSDDWVMIRGSDGVLRPRLLLVIARPTSNRPLPSHYQVRTRALPSSGDPVGPWTSYPLFPAGNGYLYLEGVEVGVTYQIRVRAVTALGRASAWAEAEHTVVGNVLPPPDVEAFDVQRLADGTRRYQWALGVIPPDIAGVLIRYGLAASSPTWEQMTELHEGVLEGASPQEMNVPVAGSWRFGIKMVDTAGNESVNMLTVDRVLGRPRRPDSIATVDARIDGWPGTKTSCFVSSPGPMLEANDLATWASLAGVQLVSTWAQWQRWNLEPAYQIRYVHPAIDLGDVVSSSPAIAVVVTGSAVVEVRTSEDGVSYTDWTEYSLVEGTAVEARYHQWRVTVTRTDAEPVPTIREMVMDAIAQPQEQFLDNLDTASLTGDYRIGVGDVRIPIDRTRFMVIRSVTLTFNGVGAGWTYVIVDKDEAIGPRVQLFQITGEPGDATVDVTVRGF